MTKGYRIIATIFLLVLTLAPILYSLSFQLQQRRIRGRMKEQLEEQVLHRITLKTNEIKWVRPGKEIAVGNHLFDVKDQVSDGRGNSILTGLYDNEETVLLDNLRKTESENSTRSAKQIAQFFQVPLILPDHADEDLSLSINDGIRFPVWESAPVAAFRTILTPPPQI